MEAVVDKAAEDRDQDTSALVAGSKSVESVKVVHW